MPLQWCLWGIRRCLIVLSLVGLLGLPVVAGATTVALVGSGSQGGSVTTGAVDPGSSGSACSLAGESLRCLSGNLDVSALRGHQQFTASITGLPAGTRWAIDALSLSFSDPLLSTGTGVAGIPALGGPALALTTLLLAMLPVLRHRGLGKGRLTLAQALVYGAAITLIWSVSFSTDSIAQPAAGSKLVLSSNTDAALCQLEVSLDGNGNASYTLYLRNGTPPLMGDVPDQSVIVGTAITPINLASYAAVTDGNAILSYRINGSLPAGLSLSGDIISGTPTASGSFTVQAQDRDGWSNADGIAVAVAPLVVALSTSQATITGANMGLAGEYYGYNDNRTGTVGDPLFIGSVRVHHDDGAVGDIDTLTEVESIIEGRNSNPNLVGTVTLGNANEADASFSANRVEFGLVAGTNTTLFSNDLGQNNRVAAGNTIGSGSGNLYTFLKASSGNVDNLLATSGIGDTTDAIVRMVGYIYIPTGGVYDIRVTADDGFRVLIGDQSVAQKDQVQEATASSVFAGQTLSEGLQPIEILYWDQWEQAALRIEIKASGAADSAYKIIGTDEFALFSPMNAPTLNSLQDIVETAANGVWAIRSGQNYTGTAGPERIVGSDGRDVIHGGAGDDVIHAGAGSDYIEGGPGGDMLTGGLGGDTFAWRQADHGAVGSPDLDTITDFSTEPSSAGGDVIDLAALLQGESHAGNAVGNLVSYLHFELSGGNTIIHVSSTGAYSTGFSASEDDLTITLQGLDLSKAGALVSDGAILQDLLGNGKLIAD